MSPKDLAVLTASHALAGSSQEETEEEENRFSKKWWRHKTTGTHLYVVGDVTKADEFPGLNGYPRTVRTAAGTLAVATLLCLDRSQPLWKSRECLLEQFDYSGQERAK